MTRDEDRSPGDPITPTPGPAARILPFEPDRSGAPGSRGTPPARRPAGLVATISLDARELARLVARDLADVGGRADRRPPASGRHAGIRAGPVRRAAASPAPRPVSQHPPTRQRPLPVASRAARDDLHVGCPPDTRRPWEGARPRSPDRLRAERGRPCVETVSSSSPTPDHAGPVPSDTTCTARRRQAASSALPTRGATIAQSTTARSADCVEGLGEGAKRPAVDDGLARVEDVTHRPRPPRRGAGRWDLERITRDRRRRVPRQHPGGPTA